MAVSFIVVFTFWSPWYNVRYNFRIKTMFGWSLSPVVCKEGSCLIYVIIVCLRIVVSKTYCVVFLFCFSSSMLTVSLDCPCLIALSVFFNIYSTEQNTDSNPNLCKNLSQIATYCGQYWRTGPSILFHEPLLLWRHPVTSYHLYRLKNYSHMRPWMLLSYLFWSFFPLFHMLKET